MNTPSAIDASGLFATFFSLALVVALIVGAAWLMKRMRNLHFGSTGDMKILAELTLGPRERLLLVRVGDSQALLALSAAGVDSVKLLDKPVQIDETQAASGGGFADKLKELMHRSGANK